MFSRPRHCTQSATHEVYADLGRTLSQLSAGSGGFQPSSVKVEIPRVVKSAKLQHGRGETLQRLLTGGGEDMPS